MSKAQKGGRNKGIQRLIVKAFHKHTCINGKAFLVYFWFITLHGSVTKKLLKTVTDSVNKEIISIKGLVNACSDF